MKLWCELFIIILVFVVAVVAVICCKCVNWCDVKMMCVTKNTKEGFCCPAAFEKHLVTYYPNRFKNISTAIRDYEKITGDNFNANYVSKTFDEYIERADKMLADKGVHKS